MPDSKSRTVWEQHLKAAVCFFQACNFVVFKVFYKDLWEQGKVVLRPERSGAHCDLAGAWQRLLPWYLIWHWELLGLQHFSPPRLFRSDASASVGR